MLLKEQGIAAEPETKQADQRPRRLLPDYSKQAKKFLESRIAGAFSGGAPPIEETIPDHPGAERLRVASVLQAQRKEGNFYVQQTIENYEKKSKLAHSAKVVDDKSQLSEKRAAEKKANVSDPNIQKKRVTGPPETSGKQKKQDPKAVGPGSTHILERKPFEHAAKVLPKIPPRKTAAVAPAAVPPAKKGLPGTAKSGLKGQPAVGTAASAGASSPDPIPVWQHKFERRVDATKPAQVKAGDPSTLADAAGQSAGRRAEETKKLSDEGSKAITPPKEAPGVPPVPDDLSTPAIEFFDGKCGRTLNSRELPPITEKTPLGNVPAIVEEAAIPASPDQGGQKNALQDEKKSTLEKKKSEDQPPSPTGDEKESEKKKVSWPGETVSDQPPQPIAVSEGQKVDISSVVADLIVNEKKYADLIVKDAKTQVFKGAESFKDNFGSSLEAEEVGVVDAELGRVAAAAGVEKKALEEKIKTRREELAKQGQEIRDSQQTALTDAHKTELNSSQLFLQAVDDVRAALDRDAVNRAKTLKGKVDAEKILSDRDQLLAGVDKKFSTWSANYDNARHKMKAGLDAAGGRQAQAYKDAADKDERQLNKDANTPELQSAAREAYRPTKYWLEDRKESLKTAVERLKVAVDEQADTFKKELSGAAFDARDKIRDAAAKRLGYERGFWQKLADWISDWGKKAKLESQAWAQLKADENAQSVAKDSEFLDTEIAKLSKMTQAEYEKEISTLNDEQTAIIAAYFTSGQDRLAILTARLIARISNQQRPEAVKKLEQEILKCTEFKTVNAIAVARNPSFENQARLKADGLYRAFKGPGTDEQSVFANLGGMTAIEAHAVELIYGETHPGEDLRTRLKEELDDWATWSKHDIERANAMMAGDQSVAIAIELDQAMHGNWNGLNVGVDQDAIFKALRDKSPSEIDAIKKAYREKYGKELQTELNSELKHWYVAGSHDVDRAQALMSSDTAAADAVAIDKAMHGGWLGWGVGTDRKAIEDVYTQQRAELEQKAAANGWTTEKLKQEVAKRNQEIDRAYGQRYAKEWADKHPNESAITRAIDDEWLMSKGEKRLLVGLKEGDLAKVGAARIDIEHRGIFYSDDKIINKAIQDQYTSEFEDRKRDLNLAIDEEMDADRKSLDQEAFARKWNPDALRKRRKEVDAEAEKQAQISGAENFDRLKQEYDTQYKGQVSGGLFTPISSLGFEEDIKRDTQGAQNNKAQALIKGKGHLTDVDEIRFAIQGLGTDDDVVRRVFKGKNKGEMNTLRTNWANDPDNKALGISEDLDKWVLGDFSGREHEEMRLNLAYGESPDDPEDQLAKAKELRDFEHVTFLGELKHGSSLPGAAMTVGLRHWVGKDELALLDKDVDELQQRVNALKDLQTNHQKDPDYWQRYGKLKGDVDGQTMIVDSSVQSHRKSVDVVADTATQIIGAVVTAVIVVVSILADVGTAGGAAAATPAEAAAISALWTALGISLAGTALTMAAKSVIKGTDAYGWEEVSEDAAIGLVDALLAVATAGTAGKLLKGGSQTLMKLAEKKALGKLIANFLAHAAEGTLQSTPGAILSNALNKDNYKEGNVILNILEGAALQVAPGAILAGGIGAFHGAIKDNMLIRARTDPEFQERVYKKFKANPANDGKTRADFLGQLDHLIGSETTHGFRDPKLQEQLRAKVLEHVPSEQRGQFKDVPIRVLPDEEFKALTKSASGNAVTVFEDGKPTVIMKAGTDLSNLGEEGIHLAQAQEPATAAKVKKFDESNLKNWENLDLDTQLDIYKTKLELEIDAHERVAKALEAQKATTKNPKALAEQIERNKANLENLNKRQVEVAAIAPEDKLKMQAGTKPKPQYLDQPARLFAKDPTIPKAKFDEIKVRSLEEVRSEFDSLKQAESKGQLTEDQQARLAAVGKELETHYTPAKDETLKQMERRLLDQKPNETLEQYRKRLERMRAEVERGGNVELWLRYEDLLGEVQADIHQAAGVRAKLVEAKKAWDEADKAFWAQRRAARDPTFKVPEGTPRVTTREWERLGDAVNGLERELKGLESRGSARSRAYDFGDIGKLDPCFAPGTLVATPGGRCAIDRLELGDFVLAYDWRQQAIVPREVLKVERNATSCLVLVKTGGGTIKTTREHPFWSVGRDTWQPAGTLLPGDSLLGIHGRLEVEAIEITQVLSPTLNIEVAGLHNFFVGEASVLVHNGTKRPDFSDLTKRPNRIYKVSKKLPDGSKQPIYIGKTRQGGLDDVTTRFDQHVNTKPEWKKLYDKGLLEIEIVAKGEWTEFETAIWEKHYIDKLRSQGIELENDAEPINIDTFKKYKTNFQGC